MAKLRISTNFKIKVSKELHTVLEECGFTMTSELQLLIYEKEHIRIEFSQIYGLSVNLKDDYGNWYSAFRVVAHKDVSDIQVLMILITLGVVNCKHIPEYRKVFNHSEPVSKSQMVAIA